MHIYAIGDLHLSGDPPQKPMEIFGSHWLGHKEKIKANWLESVQPQDTVIVCGDISWAMGLKDTAPDLHWLAQLPGRKVLLRGNHDYWWSSLAKMRQLYGSDFEFLQNNCLISGSTAICGSRGWVLPSSEGFTETDDKIYKREAIRLELALRQAAALAPQSIVAALHYPPLFAPDERTLFTDLLEKYGVRYCVYGHIHGENHVQPFEGERAGVRYKLVSCDTQNFRLTQIL